MSRPLLLSAFVSLAFHAGVLFALGVAAAMFWTTPVAPLQALHIFFPEGALSAPKDELRPPAQVARQAPARIAPARRGQGPPLQEPARPAPPARAEAEFSKEEEEVTQPAPPPRAGELLGVESFFVSASLPEAAATAIAPSGGASREPRPGVPEFEEVGTQVAAAAPAYSLAIPRYKENPKPFYPWRARLRGDQGVVLVAVRVTADGRAGEVAIHRSSGSMSLDEAAVATVKKWRFHPARRGDQPVEEWVNVPIRFRLED